MRGYSRGSLGVPVGMSKPMVMMHRAVLVSYPVVMVVMVMRSRLDIFFAGPTARHHEGR